MGLAVRRDPMSGLAKWQMRLEVVNGVQDVSAALEVCNVLNGLTCGWAYAYDSRARSIVALAALAHPVQWDVTLVRFSEVVRLAGWLSQVLASWIATRTGGNNAVSGPSTSRTARAAPDSTFFYPQALRARPEWVMDALWARYPPMDLVAGLICETLGGFVADKITADSERFLIEVRNPDAVAGEIDDSDIAPEYVIEGGFEHNSVFGLVWKVECTFQDLQQCAPSLANEMTWQLFDDPSDSLLGAWVPTAKGWTYQVSAHAAELRHYEQLQGFPGTNREILARVASTARDAVDLARNEAVEPNGADGLFPPNPSCAQEVLLMIRSLAGEIIGGVRRPDRPWTTLAGTRVTTCHLCVVQPERSNVLNAGCIGDAGGRRFLILFDRHPFVPKYVVLSEVADEVVLLEAIPDALSLFAGVSTPTALSIDTCHERMREDVQRLLIERYQAVDEHLGWTAAVLEATAGRPWDAVSPAPSVGCDSPNLDLPREEQVQAWWRAVTAPKNFLGVFRELPWAWDGSINMNLSAGTIEQGLFDTEPFLVVFSEIGRQVSEG